MNKFNGLLSRLGEITHKWKFFGWLILGIEPKKRVGNSVFQDEEKSNILRKLLQSKDPEDIQAANWLIKSMVKEVLISSSFQ